MESAAPSRMAGGHCYSSHSQCTVILRSVGGEGLFCAPAAAGGSCGIAGGVGSGAARSAPSPAAGLVGATVKLKAPGVKVKVGDALLNCGSAYLLPEKFTLNACN